MVKFAALAVSAVALIASTQAQLTNYPPPGPEITDPALRSLASEAYKAESSFLANPTIASVYKDMATGGPNALSSYLADPSKSKILSEVSASYEQVSASLYSSWMANPTYASIINHSNGGKSAGSTVRPIAAGILTIVAAVGFGML
ncbi:hypothetical protein BC940DRAFT_312142 [Gongronella butleri]|nr:hypothetical protein BC940DRAFT_312142 [Gongronella butleri]